MKKFKKFFSLATALALTASCLPMMAMAEGEETAAAEPEVLFYRDYEGYTGGNHQWTTSDLNGFLGNNSKTYGTWYWTIDDIAKPTVAVTGADGTAARVYYNEGTTYHVTNGAGNLKDISNGKLYYAFDMWGDANEADRVMFVKLVGETDSEIYALCWNPGVKWCKESVSWITGETSTDFMNGVSEKTRVELIVDPEAGTVDRYFNGNLAHQLTFTPQTITGAQMYISSGHTFDNFSVVYYPEEYTESFSITSAAINTIDNTVKVTLNSDTYDSDGAFSHATGTYVNPIAAPYGVSLSAVDTTTFTVANGETPLTVTGVTKGEKNGEYIIAVSEKLAGGTYTIAAKEGLSDIVGSVVNTDAKSIIITASAEPQILVYRDYEDYEGENDRWGATAANNPTNTTGAYGTFKFNFDYDYVPDSLDNAMAVAGKTGKGFMLKQPESYYNNGATYNTYLPEDIRTAASGELYVTFTSEQVADETRVGRTAFVGKDGYKHLSFKHGEGFGLGGWSNDAMNKTLTQAGLDFYEVGVVFDLATSTQDVYINGEQVYSGSRNSSIDFATSVFNLMFENGVIIDNLAMVYYPADILTQTFSMKENGVDTENDTISVILTSDAVDSDGANGAAVAAPYGVILPEVDTEAFTVEGATVTAVEKGTLPGEYVITVAEDLADNVKYNVTPAEGLTDIFGAVTDGASVSAINPTEPEIIYYRDFEEYTGGNPWPVETSANYGSKGLFGDRQFDSATKAETIGGTGVKFGAMDGSAQITEGTSLGTLTDGTLYIAYNEAPGGLREDVYPNRAESGNAGSNFWCWNGTGWASGANNWSAGTSTGMKGAGVNHKIELVVDIAARKVYRYVDGVCVQPAGCGLSAKEYKTLTFLFATGSILDDIAVVYFPEKLVSMPEFSVSAGALDAENNTVSVYLNSDSVDSDANDTAYSAPYGISLASFDASSFTVEGYTVAGVTKGEKSGEYVIALTEDVTEDAELTVTAADGLTDILGSKVNANAKSAVVKAEAEAEPVYTVSDITVADGTASVTYTNTTDKAESFVLMVASYDGDRLSEVNFETITAASGDVDVTKSVALANSVEGKTVKAFMFNSLTNLMPLK